MNTTNQLRCDKEKPKFPQPTEDCLQCSGLRALDKEPDKDCYLCHGTEKVPAKYWCGDCGKPLTFSPANYASRTQDIVNLCDNCLPDRTEENQLTDMLWSLANIGNSRSVEERGNKIDEILSFVRQRERAGAEKVINSMETAMIDYGFDADRRSRDYREGVEQGEKDACKCLYELATAVLDKMK